MFARQAEAKRTTQLLSDGTSVELVGTRWSGRTTLLRAVHQSLTTIGVNLITVRGIGQETPLEAVRISLPARMRSQIATSGAARSGEVLDHLLEIATDQGTVIVVDDADTVDDASWSVLEAVHRTLGTPLLTSTLHRPGDADALAPRSIIRFAQPSVRIPLTELRLDAIHDLLEHRAGHQLSPAVTGLLHAKSGGIPGFAVVLFDAAVAGGLVREFGNGGADTAKDFWSDSLNSAYESLLSSYPDQTRKSVEMLALAGAVLLPTAITLIGAESLEELEAHALVKIMTIGGQTLVGVNPPGLGDYFHHQPPSIRRARLTDQMMSALESASTPDAGDVLERWSSALPNPSDESSDLDVPFVIRMFSEDHRIRLAAARHSWSVAPTPANASFLLELHLSGDQDPEEIEAILTGTARGAAPVTIDIRFRWAHARWLLSQGTELNEVLEVLTSADTSAPSPRDPWAGQLDDALWVLRYAVRMETTGVPADVERTLGSRIDGDGPAGALARLWLGIARVLRGDAAEALDLLQMSEADLAFLPHGSAEAAHALALYASGDFSAAILAADAGVTTAIARLDRQSLVAFSYVTALARCALGQFDEAIAASTIAMGTGVSAAGLAFAPDRALRYLMSVAAARAGRFLAAEGLYTHAEQIHGSSDALPAGTGAGTRAALVALEGDYASGAAETHRLATSLRADGFRFAGDVATMIALSLEYDDDIASQFRERAERTGGSLYTTMLDARHAALLGEPHRVLQCAGALRELGAETEAMRHFTVAARMFRELGDDDGSRTARVRARSLADDVENRAAGGRQDRRYGFTARESEIVGLIAGGLSNGEIASRLVISVRTVESHINNIRRKTGAIDRNDVASFH